MQSSAAGPGAEAVPGGVLTVVLGLLGLAGALWLARKNSPYLQQNTLGLNTFNVITIGIVASVFIILAKIGVNKLPLGPVTTVVNAI